MKRIGVVFLMILFIVSCKPKKNEVVIEKYPNGSPKVTREYKEENGSKIAIKETKYYPNKFKQIEGDLKNEKRNGKWTYWYDNGNKWSEGYFKEGVSDSISISYYKTGTKHLEGVYKNGKKVGIWKLYDTAGKLNKMIDCDKENKETDMQVN
ncbi:MAG: hypothetical protein HXX09_03500 [Bacteroidetes bacterium]|nr:hypothetical protein [Bacteroidota bacterium]